MATRVHLRGAAVTVLGLMLLGALLAIGLDVAATYVARAEARERGELDA